MLVQADFVKAASMFASKPAVDAAEKDMFADSDGDDMFADSDAEGPDKPKPAAKPAAEPTAGAAVAVSKAAPAATSATAHTSANAAPAASTGATPHGMHSVCCCRACCPAARLLGCGMCSPRLLWRS